MGISCLIVDDEPLARDVLVQYVAKTPFLTLSGSCGSAFQAAELIAAGNVDLVFLDIEMPELSGMELARTFLDGPLVIFTTAYHQYALEGYKVDAVDYLLKPVSYEEFLRSCHKAQKRLSGVHGSGGRMTDEESIYIKVDYKRVKVDLSAVVYMEGMKDYLKIFRQGHGQPLVTLMTMKAMEQRLPAGRFMRVHRSYIINLARITSIEKGFINLGQYSVPLADSYRESFLKAVSGQFLD